MTTTTTTDQGGAVGLTFEQAIAILKGSPTQEELFTALVTIAQSFPGEYPPALRRASEILEEQSGQPVPMDEVDGFVQQLLGAAPASDGSAAGELAGGFAPPPPPPAEPETQGAAQPPIGVESDFRTIRRERAGQSNILRSIDRLAEPARYRAGDEVAFQSKSPTEIRRLQRELERAGLLLPGKYTPGFWDGPTADGMFTAMGFANQRGTTWDAVVREFQSMPRSMKPETFTPPPELKPDPVALEQAVKGEFRLRVGRDPTPEEMAEFTGHLSRLYRQDYENEVARMRAEHEAANQPEPVSSGRAFQSDIGGKAVGGVTPELDSALPPDLDKATRFAKLLDQYLGPEQAFAEGQAETEQNRNAVFQSIVNMGRLIG